MKKLIEDLGETINEGGSMMDVEQTWKALESAKGDLFRGDAVRALESVGRSGVSGSSRVFAKKIAGELDRFRKLIDSYLHNNTSLSRTPPKV